MEGKVIIAGGGTGGHLFPALALAEEFGRRGWEVIFVGGGRRWEREMISSKGWEYRVIPSSPWKGKGIGGKFLFLSRLPLSTLKAMALLRSLRPQLVLGVGGYSSSAVILASFLLGIRRAVQEQNLLPGLTNRLSLPFVHRIFVSFAETADLLSQPEKVIFTGNPIREELLHSFRRTRRQRRFTLLVLGGSQGSRAINEAIIEALPFMEEIKGRMRVIHQTGEGDRPWVRRGYEERGFDAQIVSFIEDIGRFYALAHLVVARAGGGTVAELCACGRASILIPYPYASDDHQRRNAEALLERGAARMILQGELSGERLAQEIKALWRDRVMLREMERRAKELARPQAASFIVRECLRMIEGDRCIGAG